MSTPILYNSLGVLTDLINDSETIKAFEYLRCASNQQNQNQN